MKLKLFESLLIESYKDYITKFSADEDEDNLKGTVDQFRKLIAQHKISGKEKDITYWMNKPFKEFYDFVSQKSLEKSNKELKKESKQSIKIWQNDEWIAIVPLTKEASCQYGAGTKWCTAATDSQNYFNHYFHNDKTTLIYFINKNDNSIKYADNVDDQAVDSRSIFKANDTLISLTKFISIINITKEELIHIEQKAINHNSTTSTKSKYQQKIIDDIEKEYKEYVDMGLNELLNSPTRNSDPYFFYYQIAKYMNGLNRLYTKLSKIPNHLHLPIYKTIDNALIKLAPLERAYLTFRNYYQLDGNVAIKNLESFINQTDFKYLKSNDQAIVKQWLSRYR